MKHVRGDDSHNLYKTLVYPLVECFRHTDALATFEVLRLAQWQTPQAILEEQRQALVRLLKHCSRHVPFYQRIFHECAFAPHNDMRVEELARLPILEKLVIRQQHESLKSDNWLEYGPRPSSTGGTTRETLHYYMSRATHSSVWANMMLQWYDAGYRLGDKMLYLGGSSLHAGVGSIIGRAYQRLLRVIPLSSFAMNDESIGIYISRIRSSGVRFLRGYATAIYQLASFMLEHAVEDMRLKAVFTTSETLYPEHRAVIEKAFQCKVFNEYGARDGGILAFECSEHTGLHINALTCLVEIVDERGCTVPPGQTGDILLTSLDNYAFPFIRYRVGDRGSQSACQCSCGRGFPMLAHLEGRSGDFTLTRDGTKVHNAFFVRLFWGLPRVKQYQVRQEKIDAIDILLVADAPGLRPGDASTIKSTITQRFGKGFRVNIQEVPEIPLAPSGKWKYVVRTVESL